MGSNQEYATVKRGLEEGHKIETLTVKSHVAALAPFHQIEIHWQFIF